MCWCTMDCPVGILHGPPSAVFHFQAIVGCLAFGVEGLCYWILLCSYYGAPDPPMMIISFVIISHVGLFCSFGFYILNVMTSSQIGYDLIIPGQFFSRGQLAEPLGMGGPGGANFPSCDRAWHTWSVMVQFICVSNLTDIRSEASNWLVSANKSDGKTEKRIQSIVIIFFF